ncbi:MAG: hypothetical protein HYX68_04955 [Planctomycetes bacterium]|nr:hypothetical protein [Planctomycetota bacterium]
MPPLTDSTRLLAYKDALGNWRITGFVEFELTEEAHRWVRRELNGVDLNSLRRVMHDYVMAGGEIDEVKETRPEWTQYEYHHDLRLTIQDKAVYIETRLCYREPFIQDEASILVVNIHER